MSEFLHFGDVGTETCEDGYRYVMYINADSVIIIDTTVPDDDVKSPPVVQGLVSYLIKNTQWLEDNEYPRE